MRVRSLDKAKDDWNQLRNHRMEHFGFSVSNEFYQPSPYFWTREGNSVPIMGNFRGASIFFICNGPSIVKNGYDLTLLKRPGIMTYGINNGPRTIRPNFYSCVDDPARFIKSIWLDPCITKIVPHAFAEKKFFDNEKWEASNMVLGQCPNMLYIHRNEKFVAERWLYEDTICWGNRGGEDGWGGGRSVMLLALKIMFLLGFRKVYLLGADFDMSATNTYHFDEQRSKGAVNGNMSTYEKLQNEYFPQLKPYFDAEGFNVYNLNPNSKLKVFDFVNYNDAIKEATKDLGDVDNERTWGMYSKPDEKAKWKNEPSQEQKAHLSTIRDRPKKPICIDSEKISQNNQETSNMSNPIVKPPRVPLAKPSIRIVNVPSIITYDSKTTPIPFTPIVSENGNNPQMPNQENQENKIIRNKPCGGMTNGSSSNIRYPNPVPNLPHNVTLPHNITLPDNGR